jgi:hypothetical protein
MSTLDDVTLITIETHYHELAGRALQETMQRLPIKNILTFSDRQLLSGVKNVPVAPIGSMRDYCDILLKGLWPFVETEFVIFAQWDAMVFDETNWTDDFLQYDYIGAVWPWQPPGQNVGNGGFSLRSMKLLQALRYPVIQLVEDGPHGVQEDNYISIVHRNLLEQKFGIKFAPANVATQFSYELGDYSGSMAFHGFWNIIKFMPRDTVDFFVNKRPPGLFNGLHRAHHIIAAMAETDRVDLIESCAAEIQQSPDHANLVHWLSQENFNNKTATLELIDKS